MKDLELLSAPFLDGILPHNKEYLSKYFDKHQQHLVVYYFSFPYDGHCSAYRKNFIDHSGIYCSERWVYKILARIKKIEGRLAEAEAALDYETVAMIKSGGFKPRRGRPPKKTVTSSAPASHPEWRPERRP